MKLRGLGEGMNAGKRSRRIFAVAGATLSTRVVRISVVIGVAAFVIIGTRGSWAQNASAQKSAAQTQPRRDPHELVQKAVQNELKAEEGVAEHFMFRGAKTTPKGSTTKLYAETKEGTAGLTIAYDGKPLTADQQRDEEARLQRFISNPEELKKKKAQEKADAERTDRIMRALPEAFIYEDVGEVPGTEGIGHTGDPLVKFKFHPNPNYQPPSRVEEVLTGMQGHILVDAVHYRIASIDGTLFRPVGFGWGILGRLNAGGHFVVHQQDVDNVWEISSMTVNFTGKILLVKSLDIESTEVYSGFRKIPKDLTFAQAIEMLKKEEAATAKNGAPQSATEAAKQRAEK